MSTCNRRKQHLGLGLLALVGAAALLAQRALQAEEGTRTEHVKIGIVRSVFKEVPDSMITLMNQPFNTLMYTQTGMTGELVKIENTLGVSGTQTSSLPAQRVSISRRYLYRRMGDGSGTIVPLTETTRPVDDHTVTTWQTP